VVGDGHLHPLFSASNLAILRRGLSRRHPGAL